MITNVILHLNNDLPIVADLEELPGPADRNVRCTNVRTVDGKRPQFVHDRNSTFVFPMAMIRLIEAPSGAESNGHAAAPSAAHHKARTEATRHAQPHDADEFNEHDGEEIPALPPPSTTPPPIEDEEPDEDLLARIRSA